MKHKWLTALAAVLLLAGLLVKGYFDRYVWLEGRSLSREAERVELWGMEVTPETFRELQAELPGCEIFWDVPFQGQRVPSDREELTVVSLSREDLAVLEYFPELQVLDAMACLDYGTLSAFEKSRPDCEVLYRVVLDGVEYEKNTVSLELENPDVTELMERLQYLPDLVWVELSGELPEMAQLNALREAYPEVDIQWLVCREGRRLSSAAQTLDLSGMNLAAGEAAALLAWFPDAKTVDMRNCGLDDREMMSLADRLPQYFFLWDMTIGTVTVPTDAVEINISEQLLQGTWEIEDRLPYFPNLEKVVMSHCGFDDETMDALNKRHEDVRFVWSVQIRDVFVRTDATYFYPFKFYRSMRVSNDDLYPLRYCTDMIAIDIGHMDLVRDCEWAAFMPNLTYLILVETGITDLTPLSGLKNLAYLEIFKTRITDYSPLVTCTSLVDLNLCRTYGDWRPLAQMTWLKNVWWNGVLGTTGYPASDAPEQLPKYLPNTKLVFNQFNSAERNGWRQVDNYKAMRDVMGMFYLQ